MDIYEKLKDEKLERLKNRYFGIWRGVVTNVNDPLGLGRIKAKVHELLGDKDETNWASYCSPFGGGGHGWFFMPSAVTEGAKEPQAGDGVWIMFEAGDINRPVWIGYWFNEIDGKPNDADKDVRVLETKSGHKIIFDDRNGKEKIRIEDKSGQYMEWECKENRIKIEVNQKVIVKAPYVDIGEGSKLSGVECKNTHPVCYVTGQPIGCSTTVKGES
jgi:uncharacterized protein involved in type VI secretion and phage assembly